MSLYAVLAGGLVWCMSLGGAYFYGVEVGDDRKTAQVAREEQVAKVATEAVATAAANAISKIEVQRVEITQPMLREVREKTVYRECRHTADGLLGVNAALTGERPVATGGGQLPAAPGAGR